MTSNVATTSAPPDDQLWKLSSGGDREAFERIVERYQSLICSLAYSACGNLSRSEDLAQETFVTAWQKQGDLREPAKLRSWLCGIVRTLAANARRQEQRRGGPAESLDAASETATSEADPSEYTITREQATILWRSLAGLPESYREPMVLFYRQGQSIADVATSLELSEQAVKQRLSRGRALLREELAAVVEFTLTHTKPGPSFTAGVLAALPMMSASTASAALSAIAAASHSVGTTAKGVLGKLGLGAFIGPLIGVTITYFGTKATASTARSQAERDCILRYVRYGIIVFCLVMSFGLVAVLNQAGKLYTPSAGGLVFGILLWTTALVGGIILMCQRMDREVKRIRIATNTTDEAYTQVLLAQGKQLIVPKYFESKTRFLGLPLFAMAWGGTSSDRYRPRTVCAWLAVGDIAVSPLFAFGGLAIAPIAFGAITVGVLSLSLSWGVAIGVLAVGSLAFGWWALGFAAAGVKCAVGFAAVARDYAVGLVTHANEAGTAPAKDWVKTLWFADFNEIILQPWPWWTLGCFGVALALRVWRDRQQRREV